MGQNLVTGTRPQLGGRRAQPAERVAPPPTRGAGQSVIIRVAKIAGRLVIVQAVIVVGLWWVSEEWLTPKAPAGIERVADLYAAAAGRFMMVADQRALDLLVKQASARPEIAYVGVESVDGTVLAHTDPARVGRLWNEPMTARIRSTAGTPPREIAVVILNPDQKVGPPVGRVRLGYFTVGEGTIVPSMYGPGSVVPFLLITVFATIPLGWLAMALAKPSGPGPGAAPGPALETLAQVAWANHGQFVTEAQQLRVTLAERDAQLARLAKPVGHAVPSAAIDPSQQRAILSITHAVRTSLSNILGFSKLLLRERDGSLTETQAADVLNIQRAGSELLAFVTALSELNRAEAGPLQIQPEGVDVRFLMNELATEYRSAHALDIKVECPAQFPLLRTDRTHLGQILRTLTMQASTMSGQGEIVLRALAIGKTASISIAYPGRTLSGEDLAAMFAPREAGGGRIGLTLARSLAILNGGNIAVESRPDHGIVFTLTVPVEEAHAA